MNAVAAQMANLATILVQNQTAVHAGGTGLHRTAANTGLPDDTIGPTLRPRDVATFEPRLCWNIGIDRDEDSELVD